MAFVVTAGQLQAVMATPPTHSSGARSVQLSPALSMTYEALWKAQPAVRTVISFLARNVAQLGVDPYERVSAGDRRKLHDHPLAQLLERPWPGSKWTKYRLMRQLVTDLCLYDAAFWLKMRDGNSVRALVPIPRRMISPFGRNALWPDGYRIQGPRGRQEVAADGVVHFHGYDPDNPRDGAPPIETLRQVLAEEYAAAQYREQLWRNGARTSGYIKRPADAPKWSPGAKDRFKEDWGAQYTGDGPGAGGTPLLEEGMDFVASGISPKDAQYVEARKLTREEVCVCYHVPPVMLGLMDGANFASVVEMHRMLYQDTLAPTLTQISQDIECQLLPDLDSSGSVYVEFNLNEKLRGSFEQQAAAISSSVGGPWMTRGEARGMYNLPHIDGADELIVPLNVVEGGLASPRDTAPDNPDNGPSNGQPPKRRGLSVKARQAKPSATPLENTLQAFFERQGHALATRIGAGKAKAAGIDGVFDSDRWNKELASDAQPVCLSLASLAGRATLTTLGLDAEYDEERTVGWMLAHVAAMSEAVNSTTRLAVRDALTGDEPGSAVRDLFLVYIASRAAQIARTETTHLSGFAGVEAINQAGITAVKTWIAGPSARPGHARLDGQSVPHGEKFSNGARWPGDSTLSIDDRAGCNCDIDWGIE